MKGKRAKAEKSTKEGKAKWKGKGEVKGDVKGEGKGKGEERGKGPELANYRISKKTAELLEKAGIKELFPIQQQTFDLVYEGKDIMGRDITGSGKTLAYALPLVERFRAENVFKTRSKSGDKSHLVLVVVPTRELVLQVANVFNQINDAEEFHVQPVYGGAAMGPQVEGLRRGAEIVVGTPGRILDHLEHGTLKLTSVRCIVLDEADRMLDMGFQEDMERIFEYSRGTAGPGKADKVVPKEPPKLRSKSGSELELHGQGQSQRQCLLFSATFPSWVQGAAAKYMHPDFTLVDLVKNLTNKTASSVRHFAVLCPYVNRTSILADISTTSSHP